MTEKILAYHGTNKENADSILCTKKFNKSQNDDDWLGSGVYFYTRLDNAILYNIRKYKNKSKKYPEYIELEKNKKILICEIEYDKNEVLDLNEIENLTKFLGMWKLFYDRIKKCEKFDKTSQKDGAVIDWLLNETNYFNGCKIIKNIFRLDVRFNRKISNIFNKKTRMGYYIEQQFVCVIDDSCIKSINEYTKNYENEYNIIRNFTNNILMKG